MDDHIDFEKQKLGMTTSKLFAIIGMVAGLAVGAGIGYGQLASEDYVDAKTSAFDKQMVELAKAQTASAKQISTLAGRADTHDRDIGTIVKLVKIQFVEQVDERESRGRSARRRPRSAKSRHVAKLLQLDPDDPMRGLELLEATP